MWYLVFCTDHQEALTHGYDLVKGSGSIQVPGTSNVAAAGSYLLQELHWAQGRKPALLLGHQTALAHRLSASSGYWEHPPHL